MPIRSILGQGAQMTRKRLGMTLAASGASLDKQQQHRLDVLGPKHHGWRW
jgi:hypothetical protein